MSSLWALGLGDGVVNSPCWQQKEHGASGVKGSGKGQGLASRKGCPGRGKAVCPRILRLSEGREGLCRGSLAPCRCLGQTWSWRGLHSSPWYLCYSAVWSVLPVFCCSKEYEFLFPLKGLLLKTYGCRSLSDLCFTWGDTLCCQSLQRCPQWLQSGSSVTLTGK